MSQRGGEATIERLLVRGAGADPVAERLRLERLLGQLDLQPRSLSRTAILCIHELRDPLPGQLSLLEARPQAAWMQAMQREVDRFAGVAAWPARSAAPDAAEAVAFADEAELLACLGSDLAAGLVASRWWWKLLVARVEEPVAAVAAKWRELVEHAPAALDRLADRGQAARFILALSALGVRALSAAIARRFALPVLAEIAAMPERPRWSPLAPLPPHVSPPWRAFFAEAEEATLPPARAALLGILLTLGRAPALARSDAFAAQVFAWRDAIEAPGLPAPRVRPAPPLRAQTRAAGEPVAAVERRPRSARALLAEPERRLPAEAAVETAAVTAPAARIKPAPLPEEPALAQHETPAEPLPAIASEAAIPEPQIATAMESTPFAATVEIAAEEAAPAVWKSSPSVSRPLLSLRPRSRAFGPPVDTALGGLFYLINLALYEKLYGDEVENLSLSPWDFVELIGRRLLGDPPEDPVWPLLAALAGRSEDEPAGTGFNPPQTLPVWLDQLMPRLDARLRAALGLEPHEDLASLLLRHKARVHVTGTHVDVVSSLETLPVAIRLSGLDRDPGWVAAAGRFIAFHFE